MVNPLIANWFCVGSRYDLILSILCFRRQSSVMMPKKFLSLYLFVHLCFSFSSLWSKKIEKPNNCREAKSDLDSNECLNLLKPSTIHFLLDFSWPLDFFIDHFHFPCFWFSFFFLFLFIRGKRSLLVWVIIGTKFYHDFVNPKEEKAKLLSLIITLHQVSPISPSATVGKLRW